VADEVKTLQTAYIQKVDDLGVQSYTDKKTGQPKSFKKFRAYVQVPGNGAVMPLDIALFGAAMNNDCPLKPGATVNDLHYTKRVIQTQTGEITYFNWVNPSQSSNKGGGGPRVAFRVSQDVAGRTLEAEWSGWADRVDDGVAAVNTLFDKLLASMSTVVTDPTNETFSDFIAPTDDEVPF